MLLPLSAAIVAVVLFIALRSPQQPHAPEQPALEVLRKSLHLQDGRLYLEGVAAPFTGIMIERRENGSLQSRSQVLDGLLDGLSEGWHPNGQLQVQEHFRAGVSHGLRTKYYENGGKMSEANVAAGIIEGTFRRWHENGILAEEIQMKDGQADGLALSFYPSGFMKARVQLRNGTPFDQVFWSDGEQRPQ
jgi:antitoxin component YwqK of YwqJK toxin-antitoxin module